MKHHFQFVFIIILVLLFLSECTVKNPISDDLATPVLSDLGVMGVLYLQSHVGYPISVRTSDPQGYDDILSVHYLIYPLSSSVPVLGDTMRDNGIGGDIIPRDGLFFDSFTADFAEGLTGLYRIEVIAYDLSNHSSNVLSDTVTVIDSQQNDPPVLSNPFIPDTLTVDSLRKLFLSIHVEDPQGDQDIDSVFFQIYPLLNPNPSYQSALWDDGLDGDTVAHDGVYSFFKDLSDTLRTIGEHLIRFQAIDHEGLVSRAVVVSFYIDEPNEPPVLSQLSMPDTVSRSGDVSFLISVQTDDPQGLADVRKVYSNMTKPDGTPFEYNPIRLYDDGSQGDLVGGDGLFSLSVSISAQTDTGIYRFDFFAEDQSQAISDIVTHYLTVVN